MTGYVRQDTSNNIADGNVINAADLDSEFDGLQAAFNASTGHVHDGTTGNGAPILVVGPTQDVVVSATAVTPKTTNTVDIGSSSLKFKDIFITGTATLPTVSATTVGATTGNITTVNATTVDTTNIEVTTLKAKDGTAAGSIADSTGVVTLASSILTTADINGGTLDNVVIGGTTAAAASVTTLTTSSTVTHNGGTANGVAYLNGSKVLTTGSALTYNGSQLKVSGLLYTNSDTDYLKMVNAADTTYWGRISQSGNDIEFYNRQVGALKFGVSDAEQMRLTSTGLGIGTSSVTGAKLKVSAYSAGGAIMSEDASGSTSFVRILGDATSQNLINWQDGTALRFATSTQAYGTFNERMRLDSAGNLGLGVTPSAWTANSKALQIGSLTSVYNDAFNAAAVVGFNQYHDTDSSEKYLITGVTATKYIQKSGQHQWYTAPSGTAGNAISFTQAMTLDASGNLMVGTTTALGRATIYGSDSAAIKTDTKNAQSGALIEIIAAGSAAFGIGGWDYSAVIEGTGGGSGTSGLVLSAYNGPMIFQTNNRTERARIDSSGNFLVGTTSGYSNQQGFYFGVGAVSYTSIGHTTAAVSGDLYARFVYNGTGIGSITQNGTTAVAYNTSSDYRLKENIQPMTNALAKVQALKPCTYNWKADGSEGEGFIAHELAEVCPQAVTGEKDAVDAEGNPVYQGIDTSFLVATLTAAIQEQQAIINDLRARVAQLESN